MFELVRVLLRQLRQVVRIGFRHHHKHTTEGRAAEQEIARQFRDCINIEFRRNWEQQAAEGGCDLVGTPGWVLEIKPAKVARTALENSASIASLLLTTEALVAEIPEDKPPAMPAGGPPGGDMYGGMGGM